MAEIKGTVLADTINAIRSRGGDPELQKIISQLSPAAREAFERPIQISAWYPLDTFVEFLEVDIEVSAAGNREILIARSERVIEAQLRGIYKVFVKLGSPGFVITRISAVHATYFKDVHIIPELQDHSATIKYVGFAKHHDIMRFIILGFYRKALELCGAKHVSLNFTIPISEGGEFSELNITWA